MFLNTINMVDYDMEVFSKEILRMNSWDDKDNAWKIFFQKLHFTY